MDAAAVIDRTKAACRSARPAIFFNEKEPDAARHLCDGCSERFECLAIEMKYETGKQPDMRAGIYGGMTPKQRFSLEGRGTPLRCLCGELFDPVDLRAGKLMCPACGCADTIEPLPDTGDRR